MAADATVRIKRVAPRRDPGDTRHTTLSQALELREILIAQGAEYHSADASPEWRLPDCLTKGDLALDDVVVKGPSALELKSYSQRAHYVVKITTSKREYREWLQRPGAQVIYDGHARYGRGPCFGSKEPGNHWGDGNIPQVEGIYPMAYRYLEIPLLDVAHYHYMCRNDDVPEKPEAKYRHPYVPAKLREYTRGELIDSVMAAKEKAREWSDAISRAHPSPPVVLDEDLETLLHTQREQLEHDLVSDTYRGFYRDTSLYAKPWAKPKQWIKLSLPHLVVHADWENTRAADVGMDLGATDLKCLVFAHFGCKTYRHNQAILRDYKGWKASPERIALWTTELTGEELTPLWLYHLLSYAPGARANHRGRSYQDAIRYAVTMVNNHLNDHSLSYRIKQA